MSTRKPYKHHKTLQEKFLTFFKEDGDNCWEWQGSLQTRKLPYGKIVFKDKWYLAHRLSYEYYIGPIPAGMIVMHWVCDNPKCVNPSHLKVGTYLENNLDCHNKGRNAFKKGQLPFCLKAMKGEENPNSKLSDNQRLEIKQKLKSGNSVRELMVEYNISKTHAYRFKRQVQNEVNYVK